ncbi:mitotic checkpoint regulator, MAD2B-interacting-domain-containing protein [Amylocystis lapponica]|nr:mitotic checkpoint regulator, MAD2B-interacting-domain-containing protein [Amylocystis lapponica]
MANTCNRSAFNATTMLGVENYGSDDDSDTDTHQAPPNPQPTSVAAKKSSFALPPPTHSPGAASSSGRLSLPPPKTKKAPKKITIGLPALSQGGDDDEVDERPAAKRPRLETGAGASRLLSMLPAPKNKVPILPAKERVLGGGRGPGLVFNTAPKPSRQVTVEDADDDEGYQEKHVPTSSVPAEQQEEKPASIPFLPPHLAKGKANVSVEEKHELPKSVQLASSTTPAVDFFSLGSTSSAPLRKPSTPQAAAPPPSLPLIPGVSSAPKVEDFTPPEPTPQDAYPGYYMLPTGSWAAYDPAYYRTFYDKWKRDYDAHVRALEKGKVKGFEDADTEAREFNAQREMEKAKVEIQELEERKALTNGAADEAAAPKMNIKGAALGGRARTRHQLSTLLTEAYQNREALEERIAQGRRNRKEAGNKYGF